MIHKKKTKVPRNYSTAHRHPYVDLRSAQKAMSGTALVHFTALLHFTVLHTNKVLKANKFFLF